MVKIESTLKADELHKMEYFGCDYPVRNNIDTTVARNQYSKAARLL